MMSRRAPFLVVGAALALIGVMAVTQLLDLRQRAVETSLLLRELEARLELLETEREETAASTTPAGRRTREARLEEERGDAEPEERSNAEPADLGSLLARLERLERRTGWLEADPLQRGYGYLQSEDPKVRESGIEMLGELAADDPAVRAALRGMLNDEDHEVRASAIETLGRLGDQDSLPPIAAALADEDASVRGESLRALGRLGARDSALEIGEMLGDPDAEVRYEAARTLARLGSEASPDSLFRALEDPSAKVQGAAISALGELGTPDAAAALRRMYDEDTGEHRSRLVTALRRLGDEEPFSQEVRRLSATILEGPSEADRIRAIRSLTGLAPERSREILERALQDPSSDVRAEAGRVLRGARRPAPVRGSTHEP